MSESRPRAAWVGGVCKTCGAYTHSCKCEHEFDRELVKSLFAAPAPAVTGNAHPSPASAGSEQRAAAALHASAPAGCGCADCAIDNEPCPACYAAWWKKRHPNVSFIVSETRMRTPTEIGADIKAALGDKGDTPRCTELENSIDSNDVRAWRTLAYRLERESLTPSAVTLSPEAIVKLANKWCPDAPLRCISAIEEALALTPSAKGNGDG